MTALIKKIYKTILNEKQRNHLYYFLFRFRAKKYGGNEVECPICDNHFSQFLTYGNVPRAQALCPRCNSLERNRVMWLYLQKEWKIKERQAKILHFAPEIGIEKQMKKMTNLTYIGADLNPQLADYQMDICQIPNNDNEYDLILCAHVLGHVPDEGKAIREMKRVLKTDGLAIIMTVIDMKNPKTHESSAAKTPAEKLENYGESDLVRLHGLDFGDRLAAQGFKVDRLDYRLIFSESEQKKYGLGQGAREVLYLCRK